ncbi:PREDICTED: protein S100-A13 isoform X2 [Myotis davidii]|uniref:protein S100-A13 isoform X2 n=1 Tax=Myotis davidii TaxID=225400 RepID=UPI00076708F8|nr:PREDICTED: protein S100-A13 isoform X2 [Myotis davidii]
MNTLPCTCTEVSPQRTSAIVRRIPMAAKPLTEVETAIDTLATAFCTFAKREGQKGSFNTDDFKEMATQQFPHLVKDVGSFDEKLKSLNVKGDLFKNYWSLIGELAKETRKEEPQKKFGCLG